MRLSIYAPEELRIPIERAKGKISLSKLFTNAFRTWQGNGTDHFAVQIEMLRKRNRRLVRLIKHLQKELGRKERTPY